MVVYSGIRHTTRKWTEGIGTARAFSFSHVQIVKESSVKRESDTLYLACVSVFLADRDTSLTLQFLFSRLWAPFMPEIIAGWWSRADYARPLCFIWFIIVRATVRKWIPDGKFMIQYLSNFCSPFFFYSNWNTYPLLLLLFVWFPLATEMYIFSVGSTSVTPSAAFLMLWHYHGRWRLS